MGKIILTRPALRVIETTCEVIPPELCPPPLAVQPTGQAPPVATPMTDPITDPASGEELLEHPPPEFHYHDCRPIEPYSSFLKIMAHRDVITVGERDYIKDVDEDISAEVPTEQLKMPPDV